MESINNTIDVDVETLDIEIEEASVSVEPSQLTSKRAKSTTSECWKYFTKMGPDKDGVDRARCNACNKEYKVGGKQYGTSTLNRHISKCKQIKFEDVGQVMLEMQGKLKFLKIDQMLSREMYADAIIEHGMPFKFAEYRKFRRWHSYICPDLIHISRNTLKKEVFNTYLREKEKLKNTLASIRNRICLTSDLWTAVNGNGYICLTAHYVDTKWKLNSKILNFCHMPPPHTGFELSQHIFDMLKDWEIEKKIFSITLDNASANDTMVGLLKSQLNMQKWLLCDGVFFHVRCSAYIMNLIVQEGLKVSSDALSRIRYVKSSESRKKKFQECIEQVGDVDTSIGLCLDCPTRWNSTYLMLDSAIKYQRVFIILQLSDRNFKDCPSADDWKRGENICLFLQPFFEITNLISGTSYPTSNLYFLQVWKIQRVILRMINDEDEIVKSMAERMMVKFEKYWSEYSVVLALGAALDPRLKFSTLSYCYSTIDASTSDAKVENIRMKLYELFENYARASSSNANAQGDVSSQASRQGSKNKRGWSDQFFDELKMHNHHLAINAGRSELDAYLDETALVFSHWESLDILQWWKDNSNRYPDLSIMACDLLSIPITTVASESAFSIGAHVFNKYRSHMISKNVTALICTRNWNAGFVSDDESDSDDDDNDNDDEIHRNKISRGGASGSKRASNVV